MRGGKEEYPNTNNSQDNVNLKNEPSNYSYDVNRKKILIVGGGIIFIFILLITFSEIQSQKIADRQRLRQKQEQIQDSIDSINAIQEKAIALQQANEQAIEDSIWRVERIQTIKNSVRITKVRLSSPNSAAGCSATIYYKNISNKTIKYFTWVGYCINAVGDIVQCEIRGDDVYRGKDTGPVRPGKSSGGTWDCIIYNWSAKKLILTEVKIEYTDGSELYISQAELRYIM